MGLQDISVTEQDIERWKRTIPVGKCNVIAMRDREEKTRVTVCRPSEDEIVVRMVEYDDDGETIYDESEVSYKDGVPIEQANEEE